LNVEIAWRDFHLSFMMAGCGIRHTPDSQAKSFKTMYQRSVGHGYMQINETFCNPCVCSIESWIEEIIILLLPRAQA
jgi:hypothetical protein